MTSDILKRRSNFLHYFLLFLGSAVLFFLPLRVCVIMQPGSKLAHADFLMGPLATRVYHL